jgi:carbamoylphosphate synthase large subunit
VPERASDVEAITRELGPPWVLKRRFTVGGEGMAFFTDVAQLREAIGKVRDPNAMPMIQEYIPGRERHTLPRRRSG